MNSFWRLVLVCVLAVALPLKSWAFATMPCCQLVVKTVSASLAVNVPPPCHDIGQAPSHQSHSPAHGSSHQEHKAGMSCAVCMSGAPTALSATFVSLLLATMFVGGPVQIHFVAVNYVNHVPDDVDRPPQKTFA